MVRRLLIDLPVRTEWASIEVIRTAVVNCLGVVFRDMDECHAIGTIISELLENAIKYGNWTREEDVLRLAVTGEPGHVTVVVEHPLDQGSEHARKLQEMLAALRRFPTAAAAYQARLADVAARPDGGGSGLGLARLAYEANCVLTAEFDGALVRLTGDVRP